ncbi:mltA-interacting protein, partial [Yersinia pestis PY-58]
MREIGL